MAWKDSAFNVAVFGFCVNAFVVAMNTSGYSSTLGVEITPLPTVDTINSQLTSIDPAAGIGQTLFASILSVAKVGAYVFDFLYAFPNLINQLVAQGWLVAMVFAVQTLMWFAAIAYVIAGREL